jgi:hypothetical protein
VLAKIKSFLGQFAPEPMGPPKEMVEFDPLDGKKRVLITVGADGTFEPVAWYGVAYGLAEASNIAAHGVLILTECVWQESAKAAGAVSNGD